MEKPTKFRLEVNATIGNEQWASGGITIREVVTIGPVGFTEAAAILEAFHVLCEKYKAE